MYGTGQNSPRGLQPVSFVNGSTWNGAENEYLIASGYATSLYFGDPVTLLNNGTIGIGVAGSPIVGVFVGVKFTDANGVYQIQKYWTASTATQGAVAATALVLDSADILYDIQVSTATGTPGPVAAPSLAQTNMNQNANFAVTVNSFNAIGGVTPAPNPGAGNPNSGSAFYLDAGSIASGGGSEALNLKLIRFTPVPGNVAGVVFNNATVLINNHLYKGGTGTAGI